VTSSQKFKSGKSNSIRFKLPEARSVQDLLIGHKVLDTHMESLSFGRLWELLTGRSKRTEESMVCLFPQTHTKYCVLQRYGRKEGINQVISLLPRTGTFDFEIQTVLHWLKHGRAQVSLIAALPSDNCHLVGATSSKTRVSQPF
jgi:hypothetical protein